MFERYYPLVLLVLIVGRGNTTFAQYSHVGNVAMSGNNCEPVKLKINKANIFQASDKSEAFKLFDESELAGNPANDKGGNTTTNWFTGFAKDEYPAHAIIDLKDRAFIQSVYVRDDSNTGRFTIEAGTPEKWKIIVDDSLKNYKAWNFHDVKISAQFLRITKFTPGSNVSEVVLYGCMLDDAGPPSAISQITTTITTNNSIRLLWQSTGDDGMFGVAHKIEIRKSTKPILTEADFQSALKIDNNLQPLYAGKYQSFLVKGLLPATTYYFSLMAIDNKGNVSPLSSSFAATTSQKLNKSAITMDQFIGINAFVDDPIDKLKAVGFIREYHNWRWDEGGPNQYSGYPKNQIKWAPSAAGNFWNFDTFYSDVVKNGLQISPVLQGTVPWLESGFSNATENKPVDAKGLNPDDPNSYRAKSHHIFQFAARYGSTKVEDSILSLANGQPRNSGLGLIRYLEDWNEPNKYWLGPDAKFSPAEYAAMSSADYDGHNSPIINGPRKLGMKNADQKIKFVMAGSVSVDIQWIDELKYWLENNRPDHRFIYDVINVHHYSWLNGKNWQGGGPAKSPEEDRYRERLAELVEYRNNNFPNTEVWISEFGWDTHPSSPLSVPLIPPNDLEEVQAQWIVRAYLAFAAAGVDRAQLYMLRDINSKSGRWFATSGLTKPKGDWTPKKSWYYVYTMKNTLNNMIYIGDQNSGNKDILIYKFKNQDSRQGAYVVWSKTRSNNIVRSYQLSLNDIVSSVEKVELVPGKIAGGRSALVIKSGFVTLNVSERPTFILVDNID